MTNILSRPVPCTKCGRQLSTADFQCPFCELLLDSPALLEDDATFEEHVPSVVRSLLSPPVSGLHSFDPPKSNADVPQDFADDFVVATKPMMYAEAFADVPILCPGLDLMACNLSTFEAFVVSMVDAKTNVRGLRQMAGLSEPEFQALLTTLQERAVIQLVNAVAAPTISVEPEPLLAPAPVELELEEILLPEPVAPPVRPAMPVKPAMAVAPRPTPMAMPAAVPAPAKMPTPAPMPAATAPSPVLPRPVRAPTKYDASPVDPLQQAIAFEQAGQMDRAIQVLETAVKRSKQPATVYNRLGMVLLKERRDFAGAERCFDKARQLEPDNVVFQQNYVRVLNMSAARSGPRDQPRGDGAKTGLAGLVKSVFGKG